jgi:hypothetical protein
MKRLIFWLLRLQYRKYLKKSNTNHPIFFIRGTGKQYPRYVLYTEDPNVYARMDKF